MSSHAPVSPEALSAFVASWTKSGGSEQANSQAWLRDMCDLLGLPRPDPVQSEHAANTYVFEMPVRDPYGDRGSTTRRIDLYRKDAFILESKQGVSAPPVAGGLFGLTPPPAQLPAKKGIGIRGSNRWSDNMAGARTQAQQYVSLLPEGHRPPPFVVVADVGHCIELWANFARDGKAYHQFPSQAEFRIFVEPQAGKHVPTLADPEVQERLRKVWLDPESLDPARISAKVSREAAHDLAELARALEKVPGEGGPGYHAEMVAQFLMRCMFTMFAEDTELLPAGSFTGLLFRLRAAPHAFASQLTRLWHEMDKGTEASSVLEGFVPIRKFNGQLFAGQEALPLALDHIDKLIRVAARDWSLVEPAIFGTLLERALNPTERHKLGAHYTPRAYVERLVEPTVLEPLRADWRKAQAESLAYETQRRGSGLQVLEKFHQDLCQIKILDPACGSGNFLYVALDLLKRLEGEVLQAIDDLRADLGQPPRWHKEGGEQSVHPRQFLGIEVNPRAAVIAEAVLWIGYLQWQQRNLKHNDPELAAKLKTKPVLESLHNIEHRDAVLTWDGAPKTVLVLDDAGKPKTVWDGVSTKKHPVTGLDVPDDSKVKPIYAYPNPRQAEWPQADFVVGNPPFIGTSRMRQALGDGYTEALRKTWPDVPESADFVMYWWEAAAKLLETNKLRRFGFITTNSITQTFNRRVIQQHLDAVSLVFAVPDHPWVDAADGAAVRIGMTVAALGAGLLGALALVDQEVSVANGEVSVGLTGEIGLVHADLKVGANVAGASALRAAERLSCRGVSLHGAGFIVTPERAAELGLGRISGLERHIRHYRNGKDLTALGRGVMVIDLYGVSEAEVRSAYPEVFQHLLEHVWPERSGRSELSADSTAYAKGWWLFGKTRPELRKALSGLSRFIATVETTKHRVFQFLDASILPDNMLVNVATDDAMVVGILSSRVHVVWALAAGGRLGVGNDPRYNKSRCFDRFPFPDATDAQKATIRDLGERLDTHRKRQQALNTDLTLTGMYNVLQALREGRPLTGKEKVIHEQGLCTLLRQLHDDLDAAVLDAYGWPNGPEDEEILQRLVDLNAERAEEERQGHIRWLRPEFQNPKGGQQAVAQTLDLADTEAPDDETPAIKRPAFPRKPGDAIEALKLELARTKAPRTVQDIADAFDGARPEAVELLLGAMETYGAARQVDGERWVLG